MVFVVERPYLLVLIPVVIALVIWMARGLRMQSKAKKIKYIALRSIVLTLLVLAVSGFSIDKRLDRTATIFVVDVSASMAPKAEEVSAYLSETISDMPDKNAMAVVAFGANANVEQFLTEKQIFTGFGAETIASATNMENAVSAALALYPEDMAKRMVLITDGLENEGNILNMSGSLQAQNIELNVLEMPAEIGNEVYVDDLTVPDTIRVGDKYAVTVKIISNISTNAKVSLYCGRTMKGQEDVQLQAGENQFVFYDEADASGFRSYRVMVEPELDSATVNNEYSAYAQIESKDKILLIQGTVEEGEIFSKVLDAAGVQYDRITPSAVPTSMNEMLEYKSIVLLNVYAADLRQEFLDNLESYVKNYAGGLVALGGSDSFALGGYRDTSIEKVLPVNMDLTGERQIPKMEMIMVIDHSGSMSMTDAANASISALDLAKAAANAALNNLRKTDNVGVLAFDDGYTWVISPQEARDKEALGEKIGSITIGGGTSIIPAVKEAYDKLVASDAQIKHIVLMTDGQDTYRNYEGLCQDIRNANITLSSVAIGAEADTKLMQALAQLCGGRYYYTDINQGIPRIFAKEVFLSTKEYLINQEFSPIITANSDMISALSEGAPTLLGYVASSIKPTATPILVSHKDDPILSTWQYGLGRTVAWNSDATGNWTRNWANWDGYVQFWKNVIDYTIADSDVGEDSVSVEQQGSKAVITYTAKEYSEKTNITAICTDEAGNQKEITFEPKAPGRYEAEVSMEEVGVYNLAVMNKEADTVVNNMNVATALQYSAEYRYFEASDSIDKMITLVGGKRITVEDEVFQPIEVRKKTKTNIANWLLLFALLLFMLDVVERRLNWNFFAPVAKTIEKYGEASKEKKAYVKTKKEKNATEPVVEPVIEPIPPVKQHEKQPKQKKASKKVDKPEIKKLDTNTLLQKKKDRDI